MVNLVHVVEESPPGGESPVAWLLYTTEHGQTAEQHALLNILALTLLVCM